MQRDDDPPSPLPFMSARAATDPPWVALPYGDIPRLTEATLCLHWQRLHASQGPVPLPGPALQAGWVHYHNGEFGRAVGLGQQHGAEGEALVIQATAIYANYLEPHEAARQQLFQQVAERAAAHPQDGQALYWQAYALGRFSQGVSVARALAQGLGSRVKGALERVIAQAPDHADAHIALAAFHAEVIDKVGPLVARMTYGARTDTALALFERGLALQPATPGALIEYARCLPMLQGDAGLAEATRCYEQAAAVRPADARQRLEVELARAALSD